MNNNEQLYHISKIDFNVYCFLTVIYFPIHSQIIIDEIDTVNQFLHFCYLSCVSGSGV